MLKPIFQPLPGNHAPHPGEHGQLGWLSDPWGSLPSNRVVRRDGSTHETHTSDAVKAQALYVNGPVAHGHGVGGTWEARCLLCLETSPRAPVLPPLPLGSAWLIQGKGVRLQKFTPSGFLFSDSPAQM